MILSLGLKNFKSFRDIEIDFSKGNSAKQNVFIYGENGSGKSNIVSAFNFLKFSLNTLDVQNRINEILHDKNDLKPKEIIRYFQQQKDYVANFINKSKMIDSESSMKLTYRFLINQKIATYSMTFDDQSIVEEELKYVMEKNVTTVYKATNKELYLQNDFIKTQAYKKELKSLYMQYFGKHSMLSIIMNERQQKNVTYIKDKFNDNFNIVMEYFMNICVWMKSNHMTEGHLMKNRNLLENMTQGKVDHKNQKSLMKTEAALNSFFTLLYPDIKGVYYQTEETKSGIKYKLYFKKMLCGKSRDVPYNYESTGTMQILEILPYLFSAVQGYTVIIDEIDSNIHDLMIKAIIEATNENLKGQLITTTHNTSLLNTLDYDNVYVIDVDRNGYKNVFPINKAGSRIHENHNVQERYKSGLYGGVPYTGYIDMSEVLQKLSEIE